MKSFKFIFLYLFFNIFINSFQSFIQGKYPKVKNLPLGKYFIVVESGIYIFDENTFLFQPIYEFTSNEKIGSYEEYNKIALADLEIDGNFYILCLIKDNILFLFENNNSQYKKYNLDIDVKGVKYDIFPNKYYGGKIQIIVTFMNYTEISQKSYFYLYIFVYEINSLTNDSKKLKKKIKKYLTVI